MRIHALTFATVVHAVAFAPALCAQTPPAADAPMKPAASLVERLTEWPKLEGEAAKTAKLDIEKLRRANTPEMGVQADAALTAAGAAVVPDLVAVLGKERNDEARARVVDVLDKVAGAPHTRLLAPYFTDKSRDVRSWALHRCAAFPDPELKAPAEAAFAAAKAAKEKDPKAEGADYEIYVAGLCATSAGSHQALELMAKNVQDMWGKRGVELRTALEAVRDEEATQFAMKLAATTEDRAKCVAGLNMLAGCGTKNALSVVRPKLDTSDNSIRIAAINAMRGIVDNQPPIANLAVFEAIEEAKKWKSR